jgi:hypothetical protein
MPTVRCLAFLLMALLPAWSGAAWAQGTGQGTGRVPAARVDAITGDAAVALLELEPAQPLLVGESQGRAVAVLIARDPAEIDQLRRRLFRRQLDGCVPGGPVVCCERRAQVFWVWTDRGWANTGEICGRRVRADAGDDVAPAAATPGRNDSGYGNGNGNSNGYESTVTFQSLSPELTEALVDEVGVDYQLIQMAEQDGSARVLVLSRSSTADRLGPKDPEPETLLARIAFGDAPIVLAADGIRPGQCGPAFNACRILGRDQQCRKSNGYWFYRSGADTWCRMVTCCGANCRC